MPAVTRPRLAGGVRDPRYTQYRFQDDYNAPALEGYQNTKSVGTVVHLFNWLNPSVNYSETFNPQKAYALLQGGGLVPPTVSKGWNYSTRFEFFQRKLDVNFTYYTSEEINNPQTVSGFPFNTLLQATPVGTTQDLNKRSVPLFIAGSDVQDRHARGYEIEFTANVDQGPAHDRQRVAARRIWFECVSAHARLRREEHGQLQTDRPGRRSENRRGECRHRRYRRFPANTPPDAQAAADAYNTIFTAYRNLNINRSTGVNQPLYKFFGDYTVPGGKFKGVRLGAGVQYRGREIIGNRGADTIVDPNNPARAIDDPDAQRQHAALYAKGRLHGDGDVRLPVAVLRTTTSSSSS